MKMKMRHLSWPPGEMASRLTTNQEIAGSTPAVVTAHVSHWFFHLFNFNQLSVQDLMFNIYIYFKKKKDMLKICTNIVNGMHVE